MILGKHEYHRKFKKHKKPCNIYNEAGIRYLADIDKHVNAVNVFDAMINELYTETSVNCADSYTISNSLYD